MIVALVVMALAFTWLALETDRFRVRLLVGIVAAPTTIGEKRVAWDTFDWSDWGTRQSGFNNGHYGWLWSLKDWKEPICGWDWIKGRNHIIPEYDVEFSVAGCRYKMHLNSTDKAAKALGQVMKVNTKKHRPNPLPKLTYKGNKPKRRRAVVV